MVMEMLGENNSKISIHFAVEGSKHYDYNYFSQFTRLTKNLVLVRFLQKNQINYEYNYVDFSDSNLKLEIICLIHMKKCMMMSLTMFTSKFVIHIIKLTSACEKSNSCSTFTFTYSCMFFGGPDYDFS